MRCNFVILCKLFTIDSNFKCLKTYTCIVIFSSNAIKTYFFSVLIFQELKHLLKSPRYNERLLIDDFRIHVPISKPIYSAWAGASLFGATDAIGTRSFSRESYLKENAMPDWSNLRFNSIYCDERQG
jgi:hypothetical protein